MSEDTVDTTDPSDAPPGDALPDGYRLVERVPSVEAFRRLRAANDMAERSREGVERGLQNSLYAVVVREPETVGMGRVVGDGGSVYHVCDMAVHPDHQGRGVGTAVMRAILAFVRGDAPPNAYVNLMADVDGFYERFGFEETRPVSKGMFLRIDDGDGDDAVGEDDEGGDDTAGDGGAPASGER